MARVFNSLAPAAPFARPAIKLRVAPSMHVPSWLAPCAVALAVGFTAAQCTLGPRSEAAALPAPRVVEVPIIVANETACKRFALAQASKHVMPVTVTDLGNRGGVYSGKDGGARAAGIHASAAENIARERALVDLLKIGNKAR